MQDAIGRGDLAQVVDQPRENKPARPPVATAGFGGLKQVLDLAQVGVGVAVIHQRVQVLHGLPDAHPGLVPGQVFALLLEDEFARLVSVVQPVKLFDRGARFGAVIAKRFGLLVSVRRDKRFLPRGLTWRGLRITAFHKIVPFVEASQGTMRLIG